jgi:hypothetical protein
MSLTKKLLISFWRHAGLVLLLGAGGLFFTVTLPANWSVPPM